MSKTSAKPRAKPKAKSRAKPRSRPAVPVEVKTARRAEGGTGAGAGGFAAGLLAGPVPLSGSALAYAPDTSIATRDEAGGGCDGQCGGWRWSLRCCLAALFCLPCEMWMCDGCPGCCPGCRVDCQHCVGGARDSANARVSPDPPPAPGPEPAPVPAAPPPIPTVGFDAAVGMRTYSLYSVLRLLPRRFRCVCLCVCLSVRMRADSGVDCVRRGLCAQT